MSAGSPGACETPCASVRIWFLMFRAPFWMTFRASDFASSASSPRSTARVRSSEASMLTSVDLLAPQPARGRVRLLGRGGLVREPLPDHERVAHAGHGG